MSRSSKQADAYNTMKHKKRIQQQKRNFFIFVRKLPWIPDIAIAIFMVLFKIYKVVMAPAFLS